eukprot:TRINITY_DN16620_c0_g1_i1.p1 TRINITY_DN16620_c0_g1~~TRINITY_DN16620_c0_g1_i1.p1  ORF type:complete len:518 (+),score=115.15 TRINITY_DN16620_c0_g1_i1:24-1556(+)
MYGLGKKQRTKVKHLRRVAVCGFTLVGVAVLLLESAMNMNYGDEHTHVPQTAVLVVTPAPFVGDKSTPVVQGNEGPRGKGLLSKVGPTKNLRKLLHKTSDLCKTCGTAEGLQRPSFCLKEESDPWQEQAIEWELNGKPAQAASVPAKPALVYVAVGNTLHGVAEGVKGGRQDYVEESMRQWRMFNPANESRVLVVVSASYKEDAVVKGWVDKYGIELVFEQDLKTTAEWEMYRKVFYIQGYMHPGGSRKDGNKNFNKLVMERFHILHAVMRQYELSNVLHLENDIMVYQNWATYLPYVMNCNVKLASTFASPKGIIPGVFYVRDSEALAKMLDFVNSLLTCGSACLGITNPDACHSPYCHWTKEGAESYSGNCQPRFGYALNKKLKMGTYANDMTYLMNYWQYYGSPELAPLPAWDHVKGENCIYEQSGKMIFDLASFGQWYSFSPPDRDPPRPDKQYVQAMKKGRFLDPTPPPYITWVPDAHGRKVPYWKGFKLMSLHIHGKNLERFRS